MENRTTAGTFKKLLIAIALIFFLMAAAGWSLPLLAGIQVGWLGLAALALAQLI